MITSIRTHLMLLFIVTLAIVLRVYRLDQVPPSPYWEEVALGYDAYSIAQTGKDHHGNVYPFVAFPSYGDFKPSGYFYAIVPFIKLLGLNLWSVRLPSALAGVGSVLLLYLITRKISTEKTALIASTLLTIQPWSLQFSRAGFEVNLAVFGTLLGTYLLLCAYKKPWFLPLAVLAFGVSMYTYHAGRVFAPLIGGIGGISLLTAWFLAKKMKSTTTISAVLIALILSALVLLPFLLKLNNQEVSSRFSQTSIFTDLDPILKSNAMIAKYGNTPIAKLFYHRYWYFGYEIGKNILSFFTPQFLFSKGDGNLRHSVTKYGLMYALESVFIILTLLSSILFWKRAKTMALIVVTCCLWILSATLAPSLVKPTPHALRFLFASPAFSLLSAMGIQTLVTSVKGKGKTYLSFAILIAFMYSASLYLHWYHVVYPERSAADFQYGYQQLYTTLQQEKHEGEPVYVTREQGRPAMFYLYFTQYDPNLIQEKGKDYPKDQLELLQVDDYHFVDSLPNTRGLFATSASKKPVEAVAVATIYRIDGSVVWEIWRRD